MKIETSEGNIGGPIKKQDISVSEFQPPIANKRQGKSYKGKNRVTYGPYLSEVLESNEIRAVTGRPYTDVELRDRFLRKYPKPGLRRQFAAYRLTVGMFRKSYNQGELYSNQPANFLISLQYDESGAALVGGRKYTTYISFEEVVDRCVFFQIADPRFIKHDLIVKIRNKINSGDEEWMGWRVPNDEWITAFEKLIGKKAYGSVAFQDGWGPREVD